MAKIIKGSILGRIHGKIGGISIYPLKNVGMVIRQKGGPSKEQMQNNPNFEVTKKNQNEFGGCATAAAAIRKGLETTSKIFQNGDFSGKLVGKLRLVAQSGHGEHGTRDIHLFNAPQHLLNFEIRNDNLFGKIYQAPLMSNLNATRTAVDIHIPKTTPEDHKNLPQNITHFQLILGISLMSKYRFNKKTKKYQPANSQQNAIGSTTQSIPLEVYSTYHGLQFSAEIPNRTPLAPEVSASVWMGIIYGRVEQGRFVDMAANRAMKCVAVV